MATTPNTSSFKITPMTNEKHAERSIGVRDAQGNLTMEFIVQRQGCRPSRARLSETLKAASWQASLSLELTPIEQQLEPVLQKQKPKQQQHTFRTRITIDELLNPMPKQ